MDSINSNYHAVCNCIPGLNTVSVTCPIHGQMPHFTLTTGTGVHNTTPATSWEEVYKKAQEHAATIGSHGIFGEVNFTDSVEATSYYQNLINYLSQHWPVSPTPMSETWEEKYINAVKYWHIQRPNLIEQVQRHDWRSILDIIALLDEHVFSAPSLHQVDRWVRVEDGPPKNMKTHILLNKRSVQMMGWYDSGSDSWIVNQVKYNYPDNPITHYQEQPPLPAAPETDKNI